MKRLLTLTAIAAVVATAVTPALAANSRLHEGVMFVQNHTVRIIAVSRRTRRSEIAPASTSQSKPAVA